jgi:hypothetical protein
MTAFLDLLLKIVAMNGFKTYLSAAIMLISAIYHAWAGMHATAVPLAGAALGLAGLRHAISKSQTRQA